MCRKDKELQHSHIIPSFVMRWMKETTPLGIRDGSNINQRVQDSEKDYLLCWDCEQMFSRWEKLFADNVFHPLHDKAQHKLYYSYREWALKFSVSVSWRVLIYLNKSKGLSHLSEDNQQWVEKALEVWREFLLGYRSHPGKFEQHILPLNIIESFDNTNISPYLNRYLVRSIDRDVPNYNFDDLGKPAFVYTKMGRVMLIGIIHFPNAKRWIGTKLHVKQGRIGSEEYRLDSIIMQYVNIRATKAGETLAGLSDKQAQKVKQIMLDIKDEYAKSEHARAGAQDLLLSGDAAKTITKPKQSK